KFKTVSNNPNGGGVAFMGNTCEGYSGEVGYFQYFCDALLNPSTLSSITTLYPSFNYQLGEVMQYSINTSATMKKKFNLLGDPEMPVWTATPQDINVSSSPSTITNINNQVIVTVSNISSPTDVTVCLTKQIFGTSDYEIFARQTQTVNGSLPFNFTVSPNTSGQLTVTVTAHNYLPKIVTIPVQITGDYLYVSNKDINDDNIGASHGNSDSQADAGETIELPVTLSNTGSINIIGATATLSSTSSYVTITTTSPLTYGNISHTSPNNSAVQTFRFIVDKDTPDGTIVPFTLNISANGALYTKTETFNIKIAAPVIEKPAQYFSITSGDGDGNIDIGENVNVSFDIYNSGYAEATGLTATLASISSNISISPSTVTFDNVGSRQTNNTGQIPFVFHTNTAPYSGELFTLTITTEYGKSWVFSNIQLIQSSLLINVTSLGYNGYEKSIDLKWNPPSSITNVYGYNVYRSLSTQGIFEKVNTFPIQGVSRILDDDNGNLLQPCTNYYYRIGIIDATTGNEGSLVPPIGTDGFEAKTVIPFHDGWPIIPTISLGTRAEGSPNAYDVDFDGKKEIFFGAGEMGGTGGLYAFRHDGTRWYYLDPNTTNISGFVNLHGYVTSTPAITDINNDGDIEIVATTRAGTQNLYIYKTYTDVSPQDGLPDVVVVSAHNANNIKGAMVSNFQGASTSGLESFICSESGNPALFDNLGTSIPWTSLSGFSDPGFGMASAVDLNGDGVKEIIFCGIKGIYVWKSTDGSDYYGQNPVFSTDGTFRMDAPTVVADINNDGQFKIVFIAAKTNQAFVNVINTDGTPVSGWPLNSTVHSIPLSVSIPDVFASCYGQFVPGLSVGNLNQSPDGKLKIVCGDGGVLKIWDNDGTPYNSITVSGLSTTMKVPLLADIDDNHDDIEIIIGSSSDGKIHAFKYNCSNGKELPGWPLYISSGIGGNMSNPIMIDDFDNNGKNEVFAYSADKFYMWNTQGDADKIEWGNYRHDSYNTGVYGKEPCSYSTTPFEVNLTSAPTGTLEWSSDKWINKNVVVKQGYTLKIKSKVSFSDRAKIIVEAGGSLIVESTGILTNACSGSLWQGIEVWGNPNQYQSLTNQGFVRLTNGATIENAIFGIVAGKMTLSTNNALFPNN
ncbi:MAG TPA: hypothetical protein DEH02_19235, partial [Bacteroidales bacterium]|nr:hypothetical protein [Bacteroidales bacterium]